MRQEYARSQKARLSPTERVFASPDEASNALRAERSVNPAHRQVPTPHVSRSRRQQEPATPLEADIDNDVAVYDSDDDARDGYDPAVRRMASHLSLRSVKSRVSFDDGHLSRDGRSSEGNVPTQFIGVGNMKPNHRSVHRGMLKPALRGSTSRVNLEAGPQGGDDPSIGITPYPTSMRQSLQPPRGPEKALPHRPISMVSPAPPVDDDMQDAISAAHRMDRDEVDFRAIHERRDTMAPPPSVLRRKTRRDFHARQYDPRIDQRPQRPSLKTLFSSFSNLSVSQPPASISPDRPSPYGDRYDDVHIAPLHPAEDLALYLHRACVPEWVNWPAIAAQNDRRRGGTAKWLSSLNISSGSGGSGSMESMGWEWSRRLSEAVGNQQHGRGRRLSGWEGMKGFEAGVLDCKLFICNSLRR